MADDATLDDLTLNSADPSLAGPADSLLADNEDDLGVIDLADAEADESSPIPYSRFKEVNEQKKQLSEQIEALKQSTSIWQPLLEQFQAAGFQNADAVLAAKQQAEIEQVRAAERQRIDDLLAADAAELNEQVENGDLSEAIRDQLLTSKRFQYETAIQQQQQLQRTYFENVRKATEEFPVLADEELKPDIASLFEALGKVYGPDAVKLATATIKKVADKAAEQALANHTATLGNKVDDMPEHGAAEDDDPSSAANKAYLAPPSTSAIANIRRQLSSTNITDVIRARLNKLGRV